MINKITTLIQFILNYFYRCQSDTDRIPKTFVFSPCSGENSWFSYYLTGHARFLGQKKNLEREKSEK